MIPSTTLQDAAALLTTAMDARDDHELRDLVAEFRAKDSSDALTLALVALCRSLCLASSQLIHALEDSFTGSERSDLTEDELMPVALEVVRSYAVAAAVGAGVREDTTRRHEGRGRSRHR